MRSHVLVVALALCAACGGGTSAGDLGVQADLGQGTSDAAVVGDDASNAGDLGMVDCPDGSKAALTPAAIKIGGLLATYHVSKHRSAGGVDSDPDGACDPNIAYRIGTVINSPGEANTAAACAIAKSTNPDTVELPFEGGNVDVVTNVACSPIACSGQGLVLLWTPSMDRGQVYTVQGSTRTLHTTVTLEAASKLFMGTPYNWVLTGSSGFTCSL